MANSYVTRTFPDGLCTTNNTNYVEFMQAPLDLFFPINVCGPSETPGLYVMYSTSACSMTGQLQIGVYDDSACTNLVGGNNIWGNGCTDVAGDDAGDGDDDDDDDDYELVDVINSEFCT